MNAREIAATVSARQASAVETVRDALDRIAAAKALNAVVTVNTECSLAEAAMIDHRLQLGRGYAARRGPHRHQGQYLG